MRPVRPAVRRRAHGRPCPTRRCQAVHKVSGGCMQALARLHRPGCHTSAAQHTTLSAALRTRAGCGSGAASSCTRKRHEPHAASRFAPTRGSRAPPTGRPRLRARRPAPCLCGGQAQAAGPRLRACGVKYFAVSARARSSKSLALLGCSASRSRSAPNRSLAACRSASSTSLRRARRAGLRDCGQGTGL